MAVHLHQGTPGTAAAFGRGDGQAGLPDPRRPEKDHILSPLDEAQGVESVACSYPMSA